MTKASKSRAVMKGPMVNKPEKILPAEIFHLAASQPDDPLAAGFYWQVRQVRVIRGPFKTHEEVKVDIEKAAKDICTVIMCPLKEEAVSNQNLLNELRSMVRSEIGFRLVTSKL